MRFLVQHIVFCASLVALLCLVIFSSTFRRWSDSVADWIYRLSTARRGLYGSVAEVPKFSVVRIAFGLVLLNRFYYIWFYSYPADAANPLLQFALYVDLLAGLAVTFGFLAQWALIFLMGFQWQFGERILATSTLGNDVAAMLSLLLLLTMAAVNCQSTTGCYSVGRR